MCGVIGLVNTNPNKSFPTELLRRMANEAQIRGQHATGIATLDDRNYMEVGKVAIPASEYKFEHMIIPYNTRAVIIHCRYSTSDLAFNQPMETEGLALIHNGVVSQADPSEWKKLFGVECETRNDSEILLRLIEQGYHPLDVQPSSQACILLDAIARKLFFWRNEERPLYYTINSDYLAVASTRDILLRSAAATDDDIWQCEPCVDYSVDLLLDTPFALHTRSIRIASDDLQKTH